jgi:hypothetical protein
MFLNFYKGDVNEFIVMQEYESIINGIQGYILWGIVFVFIAFLGCIGNIVTIIVLKRDPIMTTLNILLIALAISDILAPLANALLAFSFYHLSNRYGDSVNYLIFDDILRHIIQPLSTMFTMTSSWIVTTTTLFRLIAVLWPFKARTLINKRFALISLFVIFGVSLVAIMPLYASLVRRIKCTRDQKSKYMAFNMMVTSELMAKAYLPTIQTMCFYLPWLIALTLWLFLLRSLRRSERNFNVTFIAKESSTQAALPFVAQPTTNNNNLNTTSVQQNGATLLAPINGGGGSGGSKRGSTVETSVYMDGSIKNMHNGSILNNVDSRINNAQTRLRSYNRITLMVVVLCFTNLICRVFTFVSIFEVIFNEYLKSLSADRSDDDSAARLSAIVSNTSSSEYDVVDDETNQTAISYIQISARTEFPKFLAYSLLLNNIFLCINHSCNIVIYTFTNPRFKKNLFTLFKASLVYRLFSQKLNSTAQANNQQGLPNNNNNSSKNKAAVAAVSRHKETSMTAGGVQCLSTTRNRRTQQPSAKFNFLLCFCKLKGNNSRASDTHTSGSVTNVLNRRSQTKSNKSNKSKTSLSSDSRAEGLKRMESSRRPSFRI